MKLTEALVQRSDITARLGQLKQRALRNARHQEGEETAENPVELLTEYDRLAGELDTRIQQVNWTVELAE